MNRLTKYSIKGHNPLPYGTSIGKSDIHGHGIFATKALPAGHDFGITHVVDRRFSNDYIRTPLGGFINHSFAPNCKLYEDEDTLRIQTLRTVSAGEELTIDYRPWYSDEEISTYK